MKYRSTSSQNTDTGESVFERENSQPDIALTLMTLGKVKRNSPSRSLLIGQKKIFALLYFSQIPCTFYAYILPYKIILTLQNVFDLTPFCTGTT
jgi:hypothetical protein